MGAGDVRQGPGWRRLGCTVVLAAFVLALAAVLGTAGFALWQASDERREVATVHAVVPPSDGAPARLTLEVEMAELVVVPGPAGGELRIEAEHDRRRHALVRHSERRPDGAWVERVRFTPADARLLALARLKVGAEPPRLRVAVPRDRRVRIAVWIDGGLAALELGGLDLEAVELRAEGAGVQLSVAEPLVRPLESLVASGHVGSVEVRGLGNASPRTATLEQRVGELRLDLRGAWQRDADVSVVLDLAGGTAWLPADVAVDRVPPGGALVARDSEPGAPPRLRLSISERRGRLVLVDPRAAADR